MAASYSTYRYSAVPKPSTSPWRGPVEVEVSESEYETDYEDSDDEDAHGGAPDEAGAGGVHWYLAFGSNLNRSRLLSRVGDDLLAHGPGGDDSGATGRLEPIPVTLLGRHLTFHKEAMGGGKGYATLETSPRREGDPRAQAVLWPMRRSGILKLDAYEGCPTHYERRRWRLHFPEEAAPSVDAVGGPSGDGASDAAGAAASDAGAGAGAGDSAGHDAAGATPATPAAARGGRVITAQVYLHHTSMHSPTLLPARDYLHHLITGVREGLSRAYVRWLAAHPRAREVYIAIPQDLPLTEKLVAQGDALEVGAEVSTPILVGHVSAAAAADAPAGVGAGASEGSGMAVFSVHADHVNATLKNWQREEAVTHKTKGPVTLAHVDSDDEGVHSAEAARATGDDAADKGGKPEEWRRVTARIVQHSKPS